MRRRGFAMLVALMLMALLALIAIAVLAMSSESRRRAIKLTRTEVRESCAFSGLTYARTYFGNNFTSWSTFLSTPNKYNPMNLPTTTTPAWGAAKADLSSTSSVAAIQATHPQLFLDLDSDAKADVYIFIRDNYDEFPPAVPNFQRDNDQNVIVGALCISSTMLPRREDGTVDPDYLMMESALAVNQQGANYAQTNAGGNFNDNATN